MKDYDKKKVMSIVKRKVTRVVKLWNRVCGDAELADIALNAEYDIIEYVSAQLDAAFEAGQCSRCGGPL